jgi:RNA polymerase sigma-70 factor (ECF subfamily)
MTRSDMLTTRLYHAHVGALRAYVCRLLGDSFRGEDVVQETLLRVWLHADRLIDDETATRAWLYRVARNIVIDEIRRRAARPDEILGGTVEVAVADVMDPVLTGIVLRDALARLSPEHRSVLVTVFYLDRTTDEAATILSIPRGTARSRLYYGLRHLQASLESSGAGRRPEQAMTS